MCSIQKGTLLSYERNEKSTTIFLLLISLIVAVLLSPKDAYFLANFSYYWLPQAIVYALLFALKFRLAVIAGAIIALTISLIGYAMFNDSVAWIGYIFIVPVGFFGSMSYGFFLKSKETVSFSEALVSTTFCTITAIAIAQFILCSSVMYCGW